MHITRFEARNFMGLRVARIDPQGNLILVGGKNGAGKTSLLAGIAACLGGQKAMPELPLRQGAASGNLLVTLQDGPDTFTIERILTPGGERLVVKGRTGTSQQMFDRLVGRLSFDPLLFTRQSPKQQLDTLKELVGLNFDQLDYDRKATFEERTGVNRDLKKAEATLEGMHFYAEAPEAEISVDALVSELAQRQAQNTANAASRNRVDLLRQEGSQIRSKLTGIKDQIADLERRLEALRLQETAVTEELAAKAETHREAAAVAAALFDADISDLQQQIRQAGATNRQVQDNARRHAFAASVEELRDISKGLTAKIETFDRDKAGLIAAAPFPIPGLGLDDTGVTLHNVPFGQVSQAEKLRVSVALGLALNPELQVLLIRDGSLLDADSLALIAKMAEEASAQIWIEVVRTDEGCQIVIEDGEVVDTSAPVEDEAPILPFEEAAEVADQAWDFDGEEPLATVKHRCGHSTTYEAQATGNPWLPCPTCAEGVSA